MNHGNLNEDLRRACMISEANSASVGTDIDGGGGMTSDPEKKDEYQKLRSIKRQSTLSNEDEGGAFETLIREVIERSSDFERSTDDINTIIESLKDLEITPEMFRQFLQNSTARKKVGKWSSEEDKLVKVAVTLFGAKSWYKIAQFVPGRMLSQCRERWVNCLEQEVNRGKWTKEEDAKLREAIAEHGYSSWSKIASHMSTCRTDNQCFRRWRSLYADQVRLVQKARRLQREAIDAVKAS